MSATHPLRPFRRGLLQPGRRSVADGSFGRDAPDGKRPNVVGDEWRCPLSIVPLSQTRTLRDTRGTSAFQVLSLAIDYARSSLDDFVAHGGELRLNDETFSVNWLRL